MKKVYKSAIRKKSRRKYYIAGASFLLIALAVAARAGYLVYADLQAAAHKCEVEKNKTGLKREWVHADWRWYTLRLPVTLVESLPYYGKEN